MKKCFIDCIKKYKANKVFNKIRKATKRALFN